MLQQNILRDSENESDLYGKKISRQFRIKQRSNALSDVKNTLHTHSSRMVNGKSNTETKKSKKGQILPLSKKSLRSKESSSITPVSRTEEFLNASSGDNFDNDFDIHDHFACEEANNLDECEFLSEYRFTKKEVDIFGDRFNFFRVCSLPLQLTSVECVDDVELTDPRMSYKDENIEEITISFDVPCPPSL